MQLLTAEKLGLEGRVDRESIIVSCQNSKHRHRLGLCASGHVLGNFAPIQSTPVGIRWRGKTDLFAQRLHERTVP